MSELLSWKSEGYKFPSGLKSDCLWYISGQPLQVVTTTLSPPEHLWNMSSLNKRYSIYRQPLKY